MLQANGHHAVLGISLAASAVLHLVAATLLSRAVIGGPADLPGGDARARAVADPIPLGIEHSDAVAVNWLGFESATEHGGPESEVEQSAMALAPEANPEAGDEGAADTSAPPPPIADRRTAVAALRAIDSARAAVLALADALSAAIEGLPESARADDRTPPDPSAPPGAVSAPTTDAVPSLAARARPRGSASDQSDARAAVVTDKESIASALRDAPSVAPGRVLAAEGLEIQTRRPRWSRVTQLTRSPANPVVQITFGRDGSVRRAGFLSDGAVVFGSGFQDVDEPLLSAIFLWTARGEALDRLPPDDPEAGVTIRVRVILLS
ncbi:MAG: hypothetical protein ACKVU4_14935 [Phycisphaerales bacterium]